MYPHIQIPRKMDERKQNETFLINNENSLPLLDGWQRRIMEHKILPPFYIIGHMSEGVFIPKYKTFS